jgi:hypothetical protein
MKVKKQNPTAKLVELLHLNSLIVCVTRHSLLPGGEPAYEQSTDLKGDQRYPVARIGYCERQYRRDKEIVKTGNGNQGDKRRLPYPIGK